MGCGHLAGSRKRAVRPCQAYPLCSRTTTPKLGSNLNPECKCIRGGMKPRGMRHPNPVDTDNPTRGLRPAKWKRGGRVGTFIYWEHSGNAHCWQDMRTAGLTSGAIREPLPPRSTLELLKGNCRPTCWSARQQPKSEITSQGQPSAESGQAQCHSRPRLLVLLTAPPRSL